MPKSKAKTKAKPLSPRDKFFKDNPDKIHFKLKKGKRKPTKKASGRGR